MADSANPQGTSDRIISDPAVCGGRPVIRGTRMRVADILDMLADGATQEDILGDFDYLTQADIRAALAYAAKEVGHRVIRAA
ncbi:DUF433 domain-containing protein [Mangrovicella endophytica]|uniref:DUF433 domain-containing protein n=1 Tax=Mangrovicella endophytica TaxID=2066697 RepID=UPI000C9E1034|nr:DUF433 domain-containing protein [Mangrovicella endophytica]